MIEIWKDIVGYEGLYQVSNLGRIRNNSIVLKSYTQFGYNSVGLWKDKKCKKFRVHRLVAQAFIPNPHNFPHINHKDENKTNNIVYVNPDKSVDFEKSNLEWCTPKYNNSYGTKTKRQLETYKKHNTSNAEKEVVMLSLDGDIVNVYKSLSDASRQTGLSLGSLSEVCNKMPHRLTLGGYKWKFKE